MPFVILYDGTEALSLRRGIQGPKLLIITSNAPFPQWDTTLAGDTTMAAAMLDRLLHHAHVAMISGESFRLRERKRAGITLPGANPKQK